MDIPLFVRSLIIGVSIAAPVGPIGVLVIRRTLTGGRRLGLASGLGVATADALYSSVAGFGLNVISSLLLEYNLWFRIAGGLFLCYLGLKTTLTPPAAHAAASDGRGLLGAYASTLILAATNPLTILAFVALFAGLGVGIADGTHRTAAITVTGVFSGSASWWLVLTSGTGILRTRITPGLLRWINRGSGLLMLAFGLVTLLTR